MLSTARYSEYPARELALRELEYLQIGQGALCAKALPGVDAI
jgi:hypothetical protein